MKKPARGGLGIVGVKVSWHGGASNGRDWMLEWLGYVATVIASVTGTLVIVDRIQKHRRRIGRDAKFWLESPMGRAPNEFTPPDPDPSKPDSIHVEATLYNNSGEPLVLEEWDCEGAPLPAQRKDFRPQLTILPGETKTISTSMGPDWDKWRQQLSSGQTSPDDGEVRISLIALFRASSKRENIRLETYIVPHETIRKNAVKALAISTDTMSA